MDELSRAAKAARKAGVSYGKYMAMLHGTPVMGVPEEQEQEKPRQRRCKACGALLIGRTARAMYCNQNCKKRWYHREGRHEQTQV